MDNRIMLAAVMMAVSACGDVGPEPDCVNDGVVCANENSESLTRAASIARCQAGEPIWEASCYAEPERWLREDVSCYDALAMRARTAPVCVGDATGSVPICVDICPLILGL